MDPGAGESRKTPKVDGVGEHCSERGPAFPEWRLPVGDHTRMGDGARWWKRHPISK